ncbi:MAG TPA: aminomethyl-transferring glycine dehydrogenase subunit GcvPB, partial [Acidimicrobiia bacterium]|nr:aminomethyl-transferring glycine dehydrogenase subunit GcvPB [Acidimicrobiia bacterium]
MAATSGGPVPELLRRPSAGRAASAPIMGRDGEPTLFEQSSPGRRGWSFRASGLPEWPAEELVPAGHLAAAPPALPEVSERDLVAHFSRLSSRNYSVDHGAYPLGSCTMKYNPKLCDTVAAMPGLAGCHPAQPDDQIQGWLALLADLERILCAVTGTAAATLQPAAGAAGELTGLLLMRAWHDASGRTPTKVLIPDSAHGTNPASVTMAGYEAVEVPSDARGLVDLAALRRLLSDDVAGLMLTNPNTVGLFEEDIQAIAAEVHAADGLLYYDGANFNAILGVVRPGDMGFDIVHLNLHKTFATPHGGGGPGAGPVAVAERLAPFLPGPVPRPVPGTEGRFRWEMPERSIGRIHGWHGNALVLARAYAYILAHGGDGLAEIARTAVLNARYLKERLRGTYDFPYDGPCMHEFVASSAPIKKASGAKALDLAKRLIEEGFHPPTMYFPLIVDEALMVEPTETESPQTVEALAQARLAIAAEAAEDGGAAAAAAPRTTPVGRVDEAAAARH